VSHPPVELKRELGLADLTLTQILFIVGLPWVGVAAKNGSSHVVFWIAAIVLFYIPSAIVVTYLNRLMPLEGGLYQWAKLGFNELTGFLVAWNLWLFAILNTSDTGLQITQYIVYILGPRAEWITGSPWFVMLVSATLIVALVAVAIRGLGVGKWIHTAGGVLMLATFAALIALPWLNVAHGSLPAFHPLATTMPVMSVMSLNLLGKMGFGAFGGFEYVAIHAGECRNPARTIGASVAIAAPIIGLMFILGTSSVLALIPIDRIDLIAPIPQVLAEGFRPFSRGNTIAIVPPLAIAALSRRAHRAGERDVHRDDPPADGRRVGRPAARLVHAARRASADAGELDRVRRRRHPRARHRRHDRRRPPGSVSAVVEFVRDLLRVDVSGDVRDPARRASFIRSIRLQPDDCALVDSRRGALGLSDDTARRRALDRADRTGGKPPAVRAQDLIAGGDDERDRLRDLQSAAVAFSRGVNNGLTKVSGTLRLFVPALEAVPERAAAGRHVPASAIVGAVGNVRRNHRHLTALRAPFRSGLRENARPVSADVHRHSSIEC
jgi:hypothetical protein